jgi:hypothetical protein
MGAQGGVIGGSAVLDIYPRGRTPTSALIHRLQSVYEHRNRCVTMLGPPPA